MAISVMGPVGAPMKQGYGAFNTGTVPPRPGPGPSPGPGPGIPPRPAWYRLLVDHYLASGYAVAGSIAREGTEVPIGWIPTQAVDPLNVSAIAAFFANGPIAQRDGESGRDKAPWGSQFRTGPPSVYWTFASGAFQLTGAGAYLGAKNGP